MDNVVISQHGPPLSQGFGYGIVLGLGALFALGMIGTTWALKRLVFNGPAEELRRMLIGIAFVGKVSE